MKLKHSLLLFAAAVAPALCADRVLIDDPLAKSSIGVLERKGEFLPQGGWRSLGGRILYDAGRAIEDGYLEVTVHGLEIKPASPDKSHLLSGWESPSYSQDLEQGAYWNWRMGSNYSPFKALASYRGPHLRDEKNVPVPAAQFAPGAAHLLRVDWKGGRIEYRMDGKVLLAYDFPRMCVRYFSVGGDRKYAALDPAPVLSNLRIVSRDEAPPAATRTVARYGVFEEPFEAAGQYAEPYQAVSATAVFRRIGGRTHEIPLFWDGGRTWRVRFSPDVEGAWEWSVRSSDPGLNGKRGVFRAEPGPAHGGIQPKVHQEWFLQHQDGVPYYLFGDTLWPAFAVIEAEKLTPAALDRYLVKRAGQGFNWVQGNLLGGANQFGPPFHDFKAERLNPAFWQETDRRVRRMNELGMVAMLFLSWWTRTDQEPGWRAFPNDEARARYARYVLARYGAFNTAFCVAGEWNKFDGGNAEMMLALGQVVARANGHGRMIAIHSNSHQDDGSVDRFAHESWMSFGDFKQDYTQMHEGMLASMKHRKPVVHAEYAYFLRDSDGDGVGDKQNSRTVDDMRHATWDVAMSAGFLVTGWGNVYNGGHRDPGPFDPEAPKNAPWDQQAPLVKRFFESFEWWRFRSQDSNLQGPAPRTDDAVEPKYIRPPQVAYWALGWSKGSGGTHVAYVRGTKGLYRYDPAEGPLSSVSIERFDPRTGERKAVAFPNKTAVVTFEAPDQQDWVFVITTRRAQAVVIKE